MNTNLDDLYTKAKAKFDDAKADLEAMERVRKMMATEPQRSNNESKPQRRAAGKSRGAVMGAVLDFVKDHSGTFTMPDVFKSLDSTEVVSPKKQSIKAALGILEKRGVIEVVSRGIGRKPSVYKRV